MIDLNVFKKDYNYDNFKFFEGATTETMEKQHNDYLPLPPIALCMRQRYKPGALVALGLPQDFFENAWMSKLDLQKPFPDLKEAWEHATWSKEDIRIGGGMFCIINIFKYDINMYKRLGYKCKHNSVEHSLHGEVLPNNLLQEIR